MPQGRDCWINHGTMGSTCLHMNVSVAWHSVYIKISYTYNLQVSLANTSIEISRENLQRFARILFPPPPETLNKMCQQGFNDTLDFLQRNNLIACTRCVAVQSTVPLNTDEPNKYKILHPRHYLKFIHKHSSSIVIFILVPLFLFFLQRITDFHTKFTPGL